MHKHTSLIIITAAALAACTQGEAPQATAELPVRYASANLDDFGTAEALTARCTEEEARYREHLAVLESFDGTPTVDGYYRSLDSLLASLQTVSFTASSLAGVHPDKALRDAGDACSQLLAKVSTDMSLSRPLYDAVSAIDTADADAETKHSVDKLLLSFQLAGVDKDDATREKIRQLNDEIVAVGQEWDRNIREDVRYLELDSADALEGLPDDYVAAHSPNDDGKIVISTQYPDALPVFEYAERDDVRKELAKIFGQRGYPQNEPVLRKLIEKR